MSLLRKLSEDERDVFRGMLKGAEFNVIVKVLDEVLLDARKQALLTLTLDGSEQKTKQFINDKIEIQGADKLILDLERLKEALTKKET